MASAHLVRPCHARHCRSPLPAGKPGDLSSPGRVHGGLGHQPGYPALPEPRAPAQPGTPALLRNALPQSTRLGPEGWDTGGKHSDSRGQSPAARGTRWGCCGAPAGHLPPPVPVTPARPARPERSPGPCAGVSRGRWYLDALVAVLQLLPLAQALGERGAPGHGGDGGGGDRPGPARGAGATPPSGHAPGRGQGRGLFYSVFASKPEPGEREIPWNRRSTGLCEVRRARSQLERLSGCIPRPVVSE